MRWFGIKKSLGLLDSTVPVSRKFGIDRGTPIDRYYIDEFIAQNRHHITGRVLEVGDPGYTRRYGSATKSDVLNVVDAPGATIVGDLSTGAGIPKDAFDCIILTHVLPFIYDVHGAVRGCRDALAPGGVVLATVPCICQISRYDEERWGDYWRMTKRVTKRLFDEEFGAGNVDAGAHGNVYAAICFLEGLCVEEVDRCKLDVNDPDYEMVVTIKAVKR